MKNLFRFLCVLVLISGLVGSVLYLDHQGHFRMEDFKIEVAGENVDPVYLAPYLQNIQARLEIYKGKSLFELPLEKIGESFEDEEWVKAVSIVRRWPNHILVTIEPKSISLAYITKAGDTQLIDEKGDLMGSVTIENIPDVAIAQGEVFEKDSRIRKKAVELIRALPSRGVLSRESVSTLHYHESHGLWMSLIDQGLKIRMGHQDFEKKSKRVSQVLRYMEANQYQGRLIDANFDRKVLVQLKKN